MITVFTGRLTTTLLLGKIISIISKGAISADDDHDGVVDEEYSDSLFTLATAFAAVFLFTNVLNTHYWNYLYLTAARIRLTVVGHAYKKI